MAIIGSAVFTGGSLAAVSGREKSRCRHPSPSGRIKAIPKRPAAVINLG
jgi:hypothetical protein